MIARVERLPAAFRGVRRKPDGVDWRASWFELFFDVVFVLVVSQLSARLVADLTIGGAAETLFLLLVAWWAWIYTTWTTNWFDPDSRPMRIALAIAMFASLLGAISIPEAFADRAPLLVAGYVMIQLPRNGFAVVACEPDDPLRPSLVRIFLWSLWLAPIWVAGAFVPHDARIVIWLVALLADYAGPLAGHWIPGLGRSDPRDWELEPAHFTERLMLFLIIALGEVIVATGITATELPVTASRLVALFVCFGIAVLLWWLYFDFHAEQTVRRFKAMPTEQGKLGRDLSYLFIPLVAGIIVCAVANELVIAHPDDELGTAGLVALGAGPVIYLLGSVAFKIRVIGALWKPRAIAAAVTAGAVALGSDLPAVAVWALILGILIALAAVEDRRTRDVVA